MGNVNRIYIAYLMKGLSSRIFSSNKHMRAQIRDIAVFLQEVMLCNILQTKVIYNYDVIKTI